MTSSFSSVHIPEPLLEFGGNGRHQDIRFGLIDHGPVDFSMDRTRTVHLGIVGTAQTIDGLREWFARCEGGLPAKKSKQPNLFPEFPGSGIGGPFRCYFEIDTRDERVVSAGRLSKVTTEADNDVAIKLAVELFADEVRSLAESERPPKTIICALPVELIERVKNLRTVDGDDVPATAEDEPKEEDEHLYEDFRGALKAATLAFRVPIQIIWPTTYDDNAVIKRKLAKLSERTVQDEATRAWNLFTALYYKSGGTPWRMIRDASDYSSTFIGISFYEELGRAALQTSSAQLFDERGEGLILKGGKALKDKLDRQPYLTADDAHALIKSALASYKGEHRNFPARLVIHKSSLFHKEEMVGLARAIDEAGIESADLIWLPRRSPVRLVRDGDYPPLRGTAMRIDADTSLLYARGSVDFYRTYPGKYVPNPLMLRAQRRGTPSWETILRETLALTKMNWNNTQFDGGLPITMRAARQVGEILKHVPEGATPDPRYRFYM